MFAVPVPDPTQRFRAEQGPQPHSAVRQPSIPLTTAPAPETSSPCCHRPSSAGAVLPERHWGPGTRSYPAVSTTTARCGRGGRQRRSAQPTSTCCTLQATATVASAPNAAHWRGLQVQQPRARRHPNRRFASWQAALPTAVALVTVLAGTLLTAVAVAAAGNATAAVYPPSFITRVITQNAISPAAVYATDITGDQRCDILITTTYMGLSYTLTWFQNAGGSPVTWARNDIPSNVARQASVAVILTGTGTRTWWWHTPMATRCRGTRTTATTP